MKVTSNNFREGDEMLEDIIDDFRERIFYELDQLEVDDIEASRDYFQSKGVEALTDIQTRNDGQRAFYFEDLDGNRLEICTKSGFGVLV